MHTNTKTKTNTKIIVHLVQNCHSLDLDVKWQGIETHVFEHNLKKGMFDN